MEYCGTRLHGGIRALQHRRRAIILAIDNRAVELGSTTGLPVVAADEVHRLDEIVKSKVSYEGVQLPTDAIEAFRASLRRHVFGREADDRPG